MAGDEALENRLRVLLSDPGWSIPAWPDPPARVRLAARRQRRHVTGLASVAGASAAIAAVVTGAVLGVLPDAARSALSGGGNRNRAALVLPALGAPGFPAAIYPPASRRGAANIAAHCPNPAGLIAPQPAIRALTIAVVEGLGASFGADLRLSDRAYWPLARAQWQSGARAATAPPAVEYAGPLEAGAARGPAALPRNVRTACGNLIARDTWLVVAGSATRRGAQTDFLLLDRRGHVLVWDTQDGV